MTEPAHIQDSAVGLASLPPDDPERVEAFAHAQDCAECALALRRAESLLAKLDALPPAPAPPAPALRAIARPILARLSALVVPTRLLSVVLLAIWLVLLMMAKRRATGGAAWGESVALVGCGAGLPWAAQAPRSGRDRTRPRRIRAGHRARLERRPAGAAARRGLPSDRARRGCRASRHPRSNLRQAQIGKSLSQPRAGRCGRGTDWAGRPAPHVL